MADKQRSGLVFRALKHGMVSLAAAGLLLAPAAGRAETLDQIARNPVMFDMRPVTVTGLVGQVDGAGNFLLIEGGSTVRVARQGGGGPPVRPGDRVEVHGVFRFANNVIEALSVTFR